MGGLFINKTQSEKHKEHKPDFEISEQAVYDAYVLVKANRGAAGVDNQTIEDFEKNLNNNLYKIWNRMSSGCYFPPAVKAVEIPKGNGKTRTLGIPTVSDRIVQTIVKLYFEPEVEKIFHEDSYGYRPNKSAIQALGVARKRCWQYNWVLDIDIKGFFDNIDHELVMKAVRKHTNIKWIIMYIERWLKAPMQTKEGTTIQRTKGTPQGGVISPVLANLFLHYALDQWMTLYYPAIPFERYADDCIYHCRTEEQAKKLRIEITNRLKKVGLELNVEKTKITYCKDDNRGGKYENTSFDFLGFTFRARTAKAGIETKAKQGTPKFFLSFQPAISNKAKKHIGQTMRRWALHKRSDLSLEELAKFANPYITGWINYYGSYYKSELMKVIMRFNLTLARWASQKFKNLKRSMKKAWQMIKGIITRDNKLFVHWKHYAIS